MTLQDLMMLYGVTLGNRRTAKQKYLLPSSSTRAYRRWAGRCGFNRGKDGFPKSKT